MGCRTTRNDRSKMMEKDNIRRTLNNFARVPSWSTTMTKSEVNYLFENHSDSVICNGRLRQIKVKALSDNIFKVYTEPL